MSRFDSFEESPPPPPHPLSHHTLESNVDFSPPPNSREPSGDFCTATLPLTINGGPKSGGYGNDTMNMIPFGSPGDFGGGYGGSGGVIIGSGGVITQGPGLESLRSNPPIGGTLGRNGNSNSNIKRSSMLDLTITNTTNTTTTNNDHDSAGPTDTMLSHSTKHPLPDDDEDDVTNQLQPHHQRDSTTTHYNTPPLNFSQPPHHHPHHHQHRPMHHSSTQFQSTTRLHGFAHKHGLNKKGLVLLILTTTMCLLLLMAVVVMGLMWPTQSDGDQADVCLTPDCLRASAQVRGIILDLHSKKKWSHFDLKSWVTGGSKIRPGIPSNWRLFESNWLDIESQF